jgi:uncharacterized protein YciI
MSGLPGDAMFVIELMYKAPLPEIDAHMSAHVKFLKKYYSSGHFLISGRKVPRDGGIILAVGQSRQSIETIMKADPFCALGLADVRVIEFRASQQAVDIQQRIAAKAP